MMDQYKKTWGSSECLYSNQPINDVKVELKHGESQKYEMFVFYSNIKLNSYALL